VEVAIGQDPFWMRLEDSDLPEGNGVTQKQSGRPTQEVEAALLENGTESEGLV